MTTDYNVTIAGLAEITGYTVQQLNNWVRNQGLPVVPNVTPRMISMAAYQAWVANRTAAVKTPKVTAEVTRPAVNTLVGRCFQTNRGGNLFRVEETVDGEVVKLRGVDDSKRRSVSVDAFWREYVEVADPVQREPQPVVERAPLDLTPYRTPGYLRWLGVSK